MPSGENEYPVCPPDNVEPSNMADEHLMNCLEDPETRRVVELSTGWRVKAARYETLHTIV
jgi:hypothetical protein